MRLYKYHIFLADLRVYRSVKTKNQENNINIILGDFILLNEKIGTIFT